MSKESKNSVVVENSIPGVEILLNVDFISDISESKEVAKVKAIKSELVLAKEDLTKSVENNVRSVSSYFAELRKNHVKIQTWLKEAQAKNRRFNANLVHDIINCGNLKLILEADDKINANKEHKPRFWSGNRIFVAFQKAVEIPKSVKS